MTVNIEGIIVYFSKGKHKTGIKHIQVITIKHISLNVYTCS